MKIETVTVSTCISGIVLALLGVVAVVWLIPMHVVGADGGRGGLTPGFMPRVAAWSMIVLGGIVFLNSLRVHMGQIPAVTEESEENETLVFGVHEVVNTLIIGVMSAVYVFGLIKVGFLAPSAIILGLTMYLTGYRKILPLVVISIGFPALLEFLLWHVLKVPLPQFPLIGF